MVTLKELGFDENLPEEHKANLKRLCESINKLRTAYGKPLKVTSGYRSMSHHLKIYELKGIKDPSKIPMQSRHLIGLACDLAPISESIKSFQEWIIENVELMAEIGLYFEDFSKTPTWVHAQIVPPKSGKRFFMP